MVFCWLDDKRSVQCRDNQIEKCSSKLMELFLELWSIARYLEHKNAEKQQLVNYFASSDPHHDISKQLVDTTFVWSFCHGTFAQLTMSWGPAGNTWRGYSRLRSGREHWAWMVVVEVRQGTLGGDGRGWGPAGNTGRGWSWLRSGREHWAWMVVVEVRQRTLCVDGRGWGPAGNTGRGWSWLRSGREQEERRRGEETRRGEKRGEERRRRRTRRGRRRRRTRTRRKQLT